MNVPTKGYFGKRILPLSKILILLLLIALALPFAAEGGVALAEDGEPAIIGAGSYEELGEEYFGYYRLADAGDLYWFAEKARTKPDISALIVSDIEINASLIYHITIDPVTGKPIYSTGVPLDKWEPIPSFSGVLDGGGHTVSGILVDIAGGDAGVFRVIEEGGEVKNPELWQRLMPLLREHEVKFIWVKGHAENEYNNRCDELAVLESRKFAR